MRTPDYEIRLEMQVSMSQGFAELRTSCVLSGVDAVCIYQDRYRSKCCRNLRFEPQFCEGVGFAHLTCRIGKFTLRVFIMEIYQYIAFYLHLTIPPSRRLACSSSQYGHVSLL